MSKKALHEVNRCHDPAFPVELYQVTHAGMLPPGRGLGDFHWHEELQFTLLTAGEGVMQVNAQDYPLRAGQAIFLGSGCIHAVTRLSTGGRYVSLNFPPRMLGFFPGSRMEQQDVLPYAVGGGWQVLTLGAEVDWQREALELLGQVVERFEGSDVLGQEYAISVTLAQLWLLLLEHQRERPTATLPAPVLRQERIQTMLTYLYDHYSEDIALSDLAEAAHVSVGECCRSFRVCLKTTPYRFLKEYRIRKGMELLQAGHTVSETAGLCGFNQVSNFIHAFKSVAGCTPLQFVKHRPGTTAAFRDGFLRFGQKIP